MLVCVGVGSIVAVVVGVEEGKAVDVAVVGGATTVAAALAVAVSANAEGAAEFSGALGERSPHAARQIPPRSIITRELALNRLTIYPPAPGQRITHSPSCEIDRIAENPSPLPPEEIGKYLDTIHPGL